MSDKNPKKKKKYEKPEIDSKVVYEVNALGCAKCPTASQISLTVACIRGVKKFS